MTYILDSDVVYVVIHMHRGVLYNTAVFANYDNAADYHHTLKHTMDEEYDCIDIQECIIITKEGKNDNTG